MTSFSTVPPPHNLAFSAASRPSSSKRPFYTRSSDPAVSFCRCSTGGNSPSSSGDDTSPFHRRLDSAIQDVLKNAIVRFDSVLSSCRQQDKYDENDTVSEEQGTGNINKAEDEEDGWNWERWKKHFQQVDEQERLLSVLKSQLSRAVEQEDYKDAARVKVAIAAAATSDTVGRVMSSLSRAIVEERYKDAAYLRDKACAGLVGWWSGISDDVRDPYGLIVQITAEHGRYVARSLNPRQHTTSALGAPLFEIYLTVDKKGNYQKQAVYLKWKEGFREASSMPPGILSAARILTSSGRKEDRNNLPAESPEDEDSDSSDDDDDDDDDLLEESSGFQSFLQNMIPNVKVRVLKVNVPEKADKDLISKVIDQVEDDDEDKDIEGDTKSKNDEGNDDDDDEDDIAGPEMDGIVHDEEGKETAVKVVIGDIVSRLSRSQPRKKSLRFPANIEAMESSSFYLRLDKDAKLQDSRKAENHGKARVQSIRRMDNLMLDLAKSIEKENKFSLRMLRDVGELLSLTLNQAQKRQQLSELMAFRRINVVPPPDPLDGLYIGANELQATEVIQLKRKFGQWKDEKESKTTDIEFHEYVEAVKLTGDPYVPAGKVAFRAKIGRRYELPHRGLIPEEFGVIARYKGQGRLSDPGFQNPRWVDGELVILDGKYIKDGPVVGFVYWAPEYHFVVFFNRLRLQD